MGKRVLLATLFVAAFCVVTYQIATFPSDGPLHNRDGTYKAEVLATQNLMGAYLAAYEFATRSSTMLRPAEGWPGDLIKREKPVQNVSQYFQELLQSKMITESELDRIIQYPRGELKPDLPQAERCFFKIYRVKQSDPPNTILFASRNFSYGHPPKKWGKDLGEELVLIVHKSGEKFIFSRDQAQNRARVGLLPERKYYSDLSLEESGDTLLQQ